MYTASATNSKLLYISRRALCLSTPKHNEIFGT